MSEQTDVPNFGSSNGLQADHPAAAPPAETETRTESPTLTVIAQAGQSLPGVGTMLALHVYDVPDDETVRARIDQGFLKLVSDDGPA